MAAFILTLSQAALAAILDVQAGTIGPVELTQIGLTDADFTVSSTLEALPGEFKRLPLAGDVLGDDIVHISALDASADAYGYRGFALYTSTGVLFAVYGQADRIAQKAAGVSGLWTFDVAITRGQADAISFGDTNFLNPPASTTQQGVIELATQAEANAGTDTLRALTPKTAKNAIVAWLAGQDWPGNPLDAATLGGHDAAWFADIVARLGYDPLNADDFTATAINALLGASIGSNANGWWERRANGMLEQRGYVNIPSGGNTPAGTITFPQPFDFTDPDSVVVTGNITVPPSGSWGAATFIVRAINGTTASWRADTTDSGQAFGVGIRAAWRAIGKAPA